MKSYTLYRFGIIQILIWLACAFLLARPNDVRADPKDEIPGEPKKPKAAQGVQAIQDALRKGRPKGPVFVAIPVAYVYGLGGDTAYCSPSIRATNSSHAMVEELIIGIDYFTVEGKSAGGTTTRYDNIKVKRQDTHYFYQLNVSNCRGLAGQLTVVRCVYSSGEDCSSAVQPIDFGAIPLRLKSR